MATKIERIHELLDVLYLSDEDVDKAIAEVQEMHEDVSTRQALSSLFMAKMALAASRDRRKPRKELPVEPKGYRRAFKGVRRDQRRTAIGREQVKDEAMFLRVTKRAMQEMQNRMLRRLRKVT